MKMIRVTYEAFSGGRSCLKPSTAVLIVKKLNSVKGLTDTFVKTSNGFKVTNPEGYVAIDRVSGDAVKLVDRMEFSFNNFTAVKAWDK